MNALCCQNSVQNMARKKKLKNKTILVGIILFKMQQKSINQTLSKKQKSYIENQYKLIKLKAMYNRISN